MVQYGTELYVRLRRYAGTLQRVSVARMYDESVRYGYGLGTVRLQVRVGYRFVRFEGGRAQGDGMTTDDDPDNTIGNTAIQYNLYNTILLQYNTIQSGQSGSGQVRFGSGSDSTAINTTIQSQYNQYNVNLRAGATGARAGARDVRSVRFSSGTVSVTVGTVRDSSVRFQMMVRVGTVRVSHGLRVKFQVRSVDSTEHGRAGDGCEDDQMHNTTSCAFNTIQYNTAIQYNLLQYDNTINCTINTLLLCYGCMLQQVRSPGSVDDS